MSSLAHQRCLNHGNREAAARCPECQHYFCRECVSEHDDRVICAACLRKMLRTGSTRWSAFAGLLAVGEVLVGVLTVWLFFYAVGRNLISIPDSFHSGTIWKVRFMDEP